MKISDVLRMFELPHHSDLGKIERLIHQEAVKTRHLIRYHNHLIERKLTAMAINTSDILAKLQGQRTQIDGITSLVHTLRTELVDAIAKLDQQGADTAQLQAIADFIDQNDAAIATAITENPDPTPNTPAQPSEPSQPDNGSGEPGGPEGTTPSVPVDPSVPVQGGDATSVLTPENSPAGDRTFGQGNTSTIINNS